MCLQGQTQQTPHVSRADRLPWKQACCYDTNMHAIVGHCSSSSSSLAHLNDSVWGAIGVSSTQGTLGATMGPPADKL